MNYWIKLIGWTAVGGITGTGLWFIYTLVFVVTGGITALDGTTITPWDASLAYVAGGLVGGGLVGLFNFLGRWTWCWAILGTLGVAPMVFGTAVLYDGGLTRPSLSGSIVISTLAGTFVGISTGREVIRLRSRDDAERTPGT